MSTLSEEDLLRMSLTGQSPTSPSFDHEKSLGNQAFKQNRLSQAIHHYTNAEQINPLSPIPPANRAMAYLKLGDWQAAKADATVALELHNALPHSDPNQSLPIKILLRRATANSQLLLHALAADDYAHILTLDPSHAVAKQRLEELRRKYNIAPSPSASGANQANATSKKRIQLLSTDAFSNGTAHSSPPTHTPSSQTARDDTALVQLPPHMMHALLNKWSGTAPASSVDFERAWRSLRADDFARAAYLIQTVGASRIRNGLLGENLTPQLLDEIVHVLTVAVKTDRACSTPAAEIMEALTTVSRFRMLLMFLSEPENKSINALIEELGRNGVDAMSIQKLHDMYT